MQLDDAVATLEVRLKTGLREFGMLLCRGGDAARLRLVLDELARLRSGLPVTADGVAARPILDGVWVIQDGRLVALAGWIDAGDGYTVCEYEDYDSVPGGVSARWCQEEGWGQAAYFTKQAAEAALKKEGEADAMGA